MSTLCVTGRIGTDAELRQLQNGTAVVSWSVADQQGWGDKRHTLWIKCAWFGDRGAKLAPHLTKGTIVEVVGTPVVEAWIKKADGTAQAQIKLTVSEVKLHGGGEKRDSVEPAPKRGVARNDMDADIPF